MDPQARAEQRSYEIAALTRGLPRWPVDLDALFARARLLGPFDLYGDHYEEYLNYKTPEGPNTWRDGTLGMIDPHTREVYVDETLSPQRRRFVLAHELMHAWLGHTDYQIKRPADARAERPALEREASDGAAELLMPADLFRAYLLDTQSGSRPDAEAVRRAAAHWDVTQYTAMRRFVETDLGSSALFTFDVPRAYRGRTAAVLVLRAFTSRRWKEEVSFAGHDIEGIHRIDMVNEPYATGAGLLLADPSLVDAKASLMDEMERRFIVKCSVVVTAHSVHCLLVR